MSSPYFYLLCQGLLRDYRALIRYFFLRGGGLFPFLEQATSWTDSQDLRAEGHEGPLLPALPVLSLSRRAEF